jgi:Tol biopolymer transport system component/predicted Ser/Thr protein kinase
MSAIAVMPEVMIGQTVSHYRVLEKLGQGGMGVVYKAHDMYLDRIVAVKTLLPGNVADPELTRRFAQEAQAIAAMNHPNIAQVYDFDGENGVCWLAMEFIDGESLAQRAGRCEWTAGQIIEIAIQIAAALAEAHAMGVIHRDVKPGNIMLTTRGEVKVLDFGLAKVSERPGAFNPDTTESVSNPGQVEGTLHYMSPEQCLGRKVDARSDIFSAGSVLYYLATGLEAFKGDTAAAVHDGILNRNPKPPSAFNRRLPAGLDRIVAKALEKDPELRYQTAADLCADLKRLKRDSVSESAVTVLPRRRLPWLIGIVVATLAASLVLTWRDTRLPPRLHVVPLTALPGSESEPSFSPDGRQVAFSWNSENEENWDIYVNVVGEGTPLRLTTNPGADNSPAWSPDGRYIAFLRQSDAGAGFFLIPPLGGLERKVSDAIVNRVGVNSPYVAWAPDSGTLVLADRVSADEPVSLFVLALHTGERRRLTAPPPKTLGDGSPAFSPDGKTVVFVRTTSLAVQDIYRVPLTGGEPTRLTFDSRRIFGLTWNRASGQLLFTSGRGGASNRLWRMSASGGEPQAVPGTPDGASLLAVTADGRRLALTRSVFDTNIWRFALDPAHSSSFKPARVISSTRHDQGPQYSPDGERIAFASNRSGTSEIWMSDRDGANSTRLTSMNGPATGTPHWSPDGRHIAFDSRPGGNPDIYVVGAGGGALRRLTTDPSEEVVPTWSRDGLWVYFASNRSGTYQIWKMPAEGGSPVQVTKGGGLHGHESPDGRLLYYAKSPNQPGL